MICYADVNRNVLGAGYDTRWLQGKGRGGEGREGREEEGEGRGGKGEVGGKEKGNISLISL